MIEPLTPRERALLEEIEKIVRSAKQSALRTYQQYAEKYPDGEFGAAVERVQSSLIIWDSAVAKLRALIQQHDREAAALDEEFAFICGPAKEGETT